MNHKKEQSIGSKLIESLSEFDQSLESSVFSNLTLRRVTLDLDPQSYDPSLVKLTRENLGVSQAIFAQLIGVCTETVAAWEQGKNNPSKMACRFMDEIRLAPSYWKERLQSSMVDKEASC